MVVRTLPICQPFPIRQFSFVFGAFCVPGDTMHWALGCVTVCQCVHTYVLVTQDYTDYGNYNEVSNSALVTFLSPRLPSTVPGTWHRNGMSPSRAVSSAWAQIEKTCR